MTTPAGPNSDTAQLVTSIKQNASRLGLTWDLTMGTVFDGDNPGNVSVVFDNADLTSPPTIGVVSMVGSVSIGTRVYVISIGDGTNFIVGYSAAGSGHLATVGNRFIGGGPTQTRNSNVWAQILGPGSVAFTIVINKKFAQTALSFDGAGTWYSTGSGSAPLFGIQIDGTGISGADVGVPGLAMASHWIGVLQTTNLSLNNRFPWAGNIILPGISAGKVTVSLWWQRNAGAGVVTMDGSDALWLKVSEVWPS